MVGQVLPFVPEFAFALEAVQSGRYGGLRAAHFNRVISKPDWSSGSPMRRGAAARPSISISTIPISSACFAACRGRPFPRRRRERRRGAPDDPVSLRDPNLAVSCVSGALSQAGRPFTHGFEIYLDEATLAFEFANLGGQGHVAMPLSVIQADGTVERPELGSGDPVDGFVRELTVAVEAVATGRPAPQLSGELARQALRLCLAEIESVRTGACCSNYRDSRGHLVLGRAFGLSCHRVPRRSLDRRDVVVGVRSIRRIGSLPPVPSPSTRIFRRRSSS